MRTGALVVVLACLVPGVAVAEPPELDLEILEPEQGDEVDVQSQAWIRLVLDEPAAVDCTLTLSPKKACECAVTLTPQPISDGNGTKLLYQGGCWCDRSEDAYMEILRPEPDALVSSRGLRMTVAMDVLMEKAQLCAQCTVGDFKLHDCVMFHVVE